MDHLDQRILQYDVHIRTMARDCTPAQLSCSSARMCRKRGRIVLVGVVGLELSRADFFDKELTFQPGWAVSPKPVTPTCAAC